MGSNRKKGRFSLRPNAAKQVGNGFQLFLAGFSLILSRKCELGPAHIVW